MEDEQGIGFGFSGGLAPALALPQVLGLGLSQLGQQLQAAVEFEQHLLAVLSERDVEEQPQPQGRLGAGRPRRPAAGPGEVSRQEVL